MKIISIEDAAANFLQLVEEATRGEPFMIAKSGRPIVTVTAVRQPARTNKLRIGFMAGQIKVPDDFDTMGKEVIAQMFSEKK